MTGSTLDFTTLTSTTPKVLSKTFSLNADGTLNKSSSANMSEGHAQRSTCSDLTEFNDYLSRLSGSQALAYGVAPGYPSATVRTADTLRPGEIARTEKFFQFAIVPVSGACQNALQT